ncbi:MAG TPA: hypothetical protein PK530_04400 [Anaerolineales bacterium]|nr:hypothetical protein [Anaerolineales bacterium]
MTLKTRQSTYHTLSTALAYLTPDQLRTHLQDAASAHGWGVNHTITLGKNKVFVKTIPVTDLELAHPFATKNLYDLPTYYNYGVGSAGLGVWRELVAHIKTTNWVLSGACENFPLMYHYRIVPRMGDYSAVDPEQHERYVTYWNGNANIGQYMLDRWNAKHELVLFLEHFPHVLNTWMGKHLDQLDSFLAELRKTVTFLRKNGLIHFDAHVGNTVTDGKRPYLTDFGLVLDKQFDLSENERAFFKKNTYYDEAEILAGLGWLLRRQFEALPDAQKAIILQKYGLETDTPWSQRYAVFLENVEQMSEVGDMNLARPLVAAVVRYREIIRLLLQFLTAMQNPQKDAKFPNAKIKRLLKEAENAGLS